MLQRVSLIVLVRSLEKTVGHLSVHFETTYDFVSLNSFLSYLH